MRHPDGVGRCGVKARLMDKSHSMFDVLHGIETESLMGIRAYCSPSGSADPIVSRSMLSPEIRIEHAKAIQAEQRIAAQPCEFPLKLVPATDLEAAGRL